MLRVTNILKIGNVFSVIRLVPSRIQDAWNHMSPHRTNHGDLGPGQKVLPEEGWKTGRSGDRDEI